LAPVVQDAVKLLRATIPSPIVIQESIDPGAPHILGNASQIQQIIMNLGTNAWHAMEERPGRLSIELTAFEATPAEITRVAHFRVGRYARLRVADQGIGMTPETRARVFEPFFTTKQPGKGTGLGLPAVHGIIRDHEGVIEVESAVGVGSVFTVYLPAVPRPDLHAASTDPRPAAPSGEGQSILVIDDEPMLVEIVQRLLGRLGYRPTGFTNVSAGLARFQADPLDFDLVVTDLNMPTIPGLQLIAKIREIRDDIPVILASGFVTEEVRRAAASFGAVTLVNKPVTGDELAEVIHRALPARRTPATRI
jgi:CheY-like chemotaxis protein